MTSDFQCTIIVAKQIHDNDIISISLRISKQQKKRNKKACGKKHKEQTGQLKYKN